MRFRRAYLLPFRVVSCFFCGVFSISHSLSVCPWLDFSLPPQCPHKLYDAIEGEIGPFSATLAQDGLAGHDQPEKNLLKCFAVTGNWTRATGRTDSELSHRAIMSLLSRKFSSLVMSLSGRWCHVSQHSKIYAPAERNMTIFAFFWRCLASPQTLTTPIGIPAVPDIAASER